LNALGRFEGPAERNVFGEPLQPCSSDPLTGFYRTGYCSAGPEGQAVHLMCIAASDDFLDYSRSVGNDLTTPMPQFAFPGLVAGDRWCLVAQRWVQAHLDRKAPRLYLRATHEAVLGLVSLDILRPYALDLN
jgi:uncharacterized protein (DUF2237 family)